MQLAGPNLLSFSYRPAFTQRDVPLDVPAIAGLTTLIRPEPGEYACQTDFAPLRDLQLREIVLVVCPHIPKTLFARGALNALQKLHIVEEEAGSINDHHTIM